LRRVSIYLALIAVLLVCRGESAACSMMACSGGDEMRPTFTIVVTHNDKALTGVIFRIRGDRALQFSEVTDDQGRLQVQNLAPAIYWLDGDFLGTNVVSICFHVNKKPSRKAKAKLTYTWGEDADPTTRMAGRLVASMPGKGGTPIWNLIHKVDIPVTAASLTLHDPLSGAQYTTTSDQDGRFSFEGLPDGTYVLHIEDGTAEGFEYSPANSIIKLTNKSKRTQLLFKGGPSGCGGNYLSLQ
jgi:hypothetical protein